MPHAYVDVVMFVCPLSAGHVTEYLPDSIHPRIFLAFEMAEWWTVTWVAASGSKTAFGHFTKSSAPVATLPGVWIERNARTGGPVSVCCDWRKVTCDGPFGFPGVAASRGDDDSRLRDKPGS